MACNKLNLNKNLSTKLNYVQVIHIVLMQTKYIVKSHKNFATDRNYEYNIIFRPLKHAWKNVSAY